MRIVFMGTPAFAVPVLDALVAAEHEIVAAYSQPPRPGGRRGRALSSSPVHARAEALGIVVRTPASLRDATAQSDFAALAADVAVVAAYGLILPRPVLDAPRLGCLNVHGSLLPRWRGAAPIQRAILAGDTETGVCIMQMESGLDTGAVLLCKATRIDAKTAGDLADELSLLGAAMMVRVLADPAAYPPTAQHADDATYASKINKAEARIDWSRSADEIGRQIRAFNPAPGGYFEIAGERVKVLAADVFPEAQGSKRSDGVPGTVLDDELTVACATGAIRPTRVQRAGRAVTSAADLLRGFPVPPGTRF